MKNFKTSLLIILLWSGISTNANSQVVDSLLNLLETATHDTIKIKTLNALSDQFNFIEPQKAYEYANKALDFAKEVKWKKGMALSYHKIGNYYYTQSDYTEALDHWLKSIKIKEELGDKSGMASTLGNIGVVYQEQSEYPKALDYYFKSLKIEEEIGNKNGMAVTLGNIGVVYADQSDYPKALDYYYKALKIDEDIENKSGMAGSLGNIGVIYYDQSDYLAALDHWQKALKIEEELGNKNGIAQHLGNIGVAYADQLNYSKALDYYFKALKIKEELGHKSGMASTLGNIGSAYRYQSDYPKALDYYFKALKIKEAIGDKRGVVVNLNNIGSLYIKTGKYIKAKEFLDKALDISEEIEEINLKKDAYTHFSELYTKTGRYKEALEMYKKHIELRDTINSEENQKVLVKKEMQFEFEKKTAIDSIAHFKQIEIKDVELAKQDAEIKVKRNQQYALFSGLFLLVVFAGFMYNRFRVTRKQKHIIEKQKNEVEEQKELVDKKNSEILDSINYAKRLQDAILPPSKLVSAYLVKSFILYKPKDIVAGDFYFMDVVEEKGKKLVYYVAADCTGHGVPGAMVSIVGANGLKRCIQEFGLRSPGAILDKLSKLVAENFAQSEEKIRDGMDLAICCLEITDNGIKRVHYAGANNPLWIINPKRESAPEQAKLFREEGGFEIKATKQAIGYSENIKPFESHTVELIPGDTLYTFSDGFFDQFGGPDSSQGGKKFKSANFKKLLLRIQDKSMNEQKTIINQAFEDWKGELEQVDDVCVIGVRVS